MAIPATPVQFFFSKLHQFLIKQHQRAYSCSLGLKKAKFSGWHISCKHLPKFKINGRNELRKTRAFQWYVDLFTSTIYSVKVPRGLKRYSFLVKRWKMTKTENEHYKYRLPWYWVHCIVTIRLIDWLELNFDACNGLEIAGWSL